jgi:archaemetzincin
VRRIDLVPFGTMQEETLRAIELSLWQVFGLEARRLPVRGLPAEAFDPMRRQYASVAILANLQKAQNPDAVRTLGIADEDLFIPMLTFVFGQAQVGGRCALVSAARLRQEFYGFGPNLSLLSSRIIREAVHEVGHTYGLLHCAHAECPMSLSNTIVQVDRKGEDLCQSCWTRLEMIIAQEHHGTYERTTREECP